MSSDDNSGESKSGVMSSFRGLFRGGKSDQASEPEADAGGDAGAKTAVPAGDEDNGEPLILGPAMRSVAADEDSVDDQSAEDDGAGQDADELAAAPDDAASDQTAAPDETGEADSGTGDQDVDGEEDMAPSGAVPEEAVEADQSEVSDSDQMENDAQLIQAMTERHVKRPIISGKQAPEDAPDEPGEDTADAAAAAGDAGEDAGDEPDPPDLDSGSTPYEQALEATIRRVVGEELDGELGRSLAQKIQNTIRDEIAQAMLRRD